MTQSNEPLFEYLHSLSRILRMEMVMISMQDQFFATILEAFPLQQLPKRTPAGIDPENAVVVVREVLLRFGIEHAELK